MKKNNDGRKNWNTQVALAGYPSDVVFEQSPNLGTDNIRVRPVNVRKWFAAYLVMNPTIVTEFFSANGLDVQPHEVPAMIDACADDLFAVVHGKLDGASGHHGLKSGGASLTTGISFRVPYSARISETKKAGAGSITGPASAPSTREALQAKLDEQRTRLLALAEQAKKEEAAKSDPAPTSDKPSKKTGGK